MASISLPTIALITAGASVVSAGVAAYGQREAGIQTQRMDRQKANAAALQARQQQINMRQKMLTALASQNAGTLGAVGTGQGSGFGANAMRQIAQNQNDLLVSNANESSQVSLLDQQGANAAAAGTMGAVGDIISPTTVKAGATLAGAL
jgi:hypothetical protein